MKTRIITGVIATGVLIPVLIFSQYIVFPIVIALMAGIAVFEMLRCTDLLKFPAVAVPLFIYALGFPFAVRYTDEMTTLKAAIAVITLTVIYYFGVLIFCNGKINICQMGVCVMSMIYVLFGFNAIVAIRDGYFGRIGGQYVFLICFLGAWITDTFAYFCGVWFGKHKLIPQVSPKKTVEGSIGGSVCCMLVMIGFGVLVEVLDPSVDANLLMFAAAGLICAVVSQIGDLSMSVIKRYYGIKDYGKLFPGHGGVLDRFDSVLAVSMVLFVLTAFFPFFE